MNTAPPRKGWKRDQDRNILSPTNLEIRRSALSIGDNVVFGFYYWYRGGQGHACLASRSASGIIDEIEISRSGDHFTLFSFRDIAEVAERAVNFDPENQDSAAALFCILRQISAEAEIVVVFDTSIPHVDVVWRFDDRDVLEFTPEWLKTGPGTVFIFRMSILDLGDDGSSVHSVSLRDVRHRVNALLDAKRPAPDGSTPSSGPY